MDRLIKVLSWVFIIFFGIILFVYLFGGGVWALLGIVGLIYFIPNFQNAIIEKYNKINGKKITKKKLYIFGSLFFIVGFVLGAAQYGAKSRVSETVPLSQVPVVAKESQSVVEKKPEELAENNKASSKGQSVLHSMVYGKNKDEPTDKQEKPKAFNELEVVNSDIACQNKENISRFVEFVMDDDRSAYEKLARRLVRTGECVLLKEGQIVRLKDTAMLDGMIKVRPQGTDVAYWTLLENAE